MTAHSKIGASSMYRWSACPGSVREAAKAPPKIASQYAEDGSDAHAYAALCLVAGTSPDPTELGKTLKFGDRIFTVDQEMVDAVGVYVEHIYSTREDGDIDLFEQRFDLSAVHPGCFGTADFVRWRQREGLLVVADYKHGAGIPVRVENNPQLQYYGLGALLASGYPARRVRLEIIQPRCEHPDGAIRAWEIDAIDLLDFRHDLKVYAQATEDPKAPLNPGDHCRFCPAAAMCPALHARALEMAKLEFKPQLSYDPAVLRAALDSREPLKAWLKALDEFAYAEAEQGRTPPGYKLVAKRATRSWRDEGEITVKLQEDGFKDDVIFAPRSLKSPAQMEKVVKADLLEPYIAKESSGHALVPESDKRPAVQIGAQYDFDVIGGDPLAIPDFLRREKASEPAKTIFD